MEDRLAAFHVVLPGVTRLSIEWCGVRAGVRTQIRCERYAVAYDSHTGFPRVPDDVSAMPTCESVRSNDASILIQPARIHPRHQGTLPSACLSACREMVPSDSGCHPAVRVSDEPSLAYDPVDDGTGSNILNYCRSGTENACREDKERHAFDRTRSRAAASCSLHSGT